MIRRRTAMAPCGKRDQQILPFVQVPLAMLVSRPARSCAFYTAEQPNRILGSVFAIHTSNVKRRAQLALIFINRRLNVED